MTQHSAEPAPAAPKPQPSSGDAHQSPPTRPPEFGGPKGPEPTRYGDWERKGRCIDF